LLACHGRTLEQDTADIQEHAGNSSRFLHRLFFGKFCISRAAFASQLWWVSANAALAQRPQR